MSDNPPVLYCANHPTVETSLRCKTCEKPICPKCAVLTPTGYSCKECTRSLQKAFDTTRWFDYPLVFLTAFILSNIGSRFVPMLGFFTLFLAPIAGVVIAEAVRAVLRRRRSTRIYQIAAIAAALGALPELVQLLYFALASGNYMSVLWSLIWRGVYLFSIPSSVLYRLKGIQVK